MYIEIYTCLFLWWPFSGINLIFEIMIYIHQFLWFLQETRDIKRKASQASVEILLLKWVVVLFFSLYKSKNIFARHFHMQLVVHFWVSLLKNKKIQQFTTSHVIWDPGLTILQMEESRRRILQNILVDLVVRSL